MAFAILLCTALLSTLLKDSHAEQKGSTTICHDVKRLMTENNGAPVYDATSSLSVGPDGPLLLQDHVLIEELTQLNRQKIPSRITHAKGPGAFGYFTVTNTSFTQFCKASLFGAVGKRTELFTRFSTTSQEVGTCDTLRAARGTALKFYTDEGNFDIVGINLPIFPIRDPRLSLSFFHAQMRNPATGLSDLDIFLDFMTLRPETTATLMYVFSDLGTPDGYRNMDFYGTHTFKVVNKNGSPFYAKFHFKTNQGVKNLTAEKAAALCVIDSDYSSRDLYSNIKAKNYPSWTMHYQIMTFEQASKFKWNPFDLTKFWPEKDYPLYEIGKLVLDTNPTNYFAQVEQSAFSPSHLVPGIEPSPDKMFQARMFAYPDAIRYRQGVNYQKLPVNAPRVPVINNMRDGLMCPGDNQGGNPNYYPTSDPRGANVCPAARESKWTVTGDVARYNRDEDNYSQATMIWESFDETQQRSLVDNLATVLRIARQDLRERAILNFSNVSPDLAALLKKALQESKVA